MEKKSESNCSDCGELLNYCRCRTKTTDTASDTSDPTTELAAIDAFSETTRLGTGVSEKIIDSKFRVIGELGTGGDSIVYLAEHLFLRKKVALKVFRANEADANRFARVQREAVLLARLKHPNLVEVTDLGVIESSVPYIVQEYVEGKDLQEFVKSRGALDQQTAIVLFIEIAGAIKFLHDNGIIHRDIKPSNVIITSTTAGGTMAKLIDLGIAKPDNPGGALSFATASGKVFGSPLYMSPEQCSGKKVDFKTDIYSFGCLMYEALTGTPPFRGETMLVTLHKHVNETPPSVNAKRQGVELVSTELEMVVAKCLAKSAEDRYDTMGDVIADLTKHSPKTRSDRLNPTYPVVVATVLFLAAVCVYLIGAQQNTNSRGASAQSLIADRIASAELMATSADVDDALKAYRDAYDEGKKERVDALTQLQLGAMLQRANSWGKRRSENNQVFSDLQPFLTEVEAKLQKDRSAFPNRSLDAVWLVYLYKGDATKNSEVAEKAYQKALSYSILGDRRRSKISRASSIIKSRLAVLSLLKGDLTTAYKLATTSSQELKKGQNYANEVRFDNSFILGKAALLRGNYDLACTALLYCKRLQRVTTSRLPDNALDQFTNDLRQRMGKATFETVMKNKTASALQE